VVQNIEVVATKRDALVTESELQARNDRRDVGINLSAELGSYRRSEPTDDVPVLRDDRAPVGALLEGMVGQRYVRVRANESGSDGAGSGGSNGTAARIGVVRS
jgi:hypothetical protein